MREREGFLDAIRAVAIVRVVIWHAFGLAAITFVVAAMPAMFFVSGSLLAQSIGRRRAGTVLVDRLRRISLPLWSFAAVAWAVMAIAADRTGTSIPVSRIIAWLVPLDDPQGTEWEQGWLSSHLWYLRALLWLLLATPLLLRAVRAHPRVTFTLSVAAVFALDVIDRRPGWAPTFAPRLFWQLGDFALYGVFLMLGFVHRDGRLANVRPRTWVTVAIASAAAAAAWYVTQPVPLGVVNNSHPMHLFVGAAWLAIALAARPLLEALANGRLTHGAIRSVGRRSLTIYLWHTAAIILAINLLEQRAPLPTGVYSTALVLLTTAGTLLATTLFGWIEDLAASRPRRQVYRHAANPGTSVATRGLAFSSIALLGIGLVGVSGPSTPGTASQATTASRPAAPSRQPPRPEFTSTTTVVAPPREPASSDEERADRLQDAFTAWARANSVPGAAAGVAIGDRLVWQGALGKWPDGAPVTVDGTIDVASLTKLFTASLVMHYVDEGLIDLDEPLPWLDAVPTFPYDTGITVADLLEHRTGLVDYHELPEYTTDPAAVSSAAAAVELSVRQPLLAPPGTVSLYSSTNYLVLGLLLEQVTGRSYDDLLRDELLQPLGLEDTTHLAATAGQPRAGTSGIQSDIADLVDAGVGILRDHIGVSNATYDRMMTVETATGAGTGSYGYCPCTIGNDGSPQFFGIGYSGGTTIVVYHAPLDATIVVNLTESLWIGQNFDIVASLFSTIATTIAAS